MRTVPFQRSHSEERTVRALRRTEGENHLGVTPIRSVRPRECTMRRKDTCVNKGGTAFYTPLLRIRIFKGRFSMLFMEKCPKKIP